MSKVADQVKSLVRKNAKAIVALVATVVAGIGLDLSVEVQAGVVAVLVWLVSNE